MFFKLIIYLFSTANLLLKMAENEEIAEIRREGLVMMNTDMLQIYISGNHYDCTLVVRDEGKRTKVLSIYVLLNYGLLQHTQQNLS